MKFLAIFSLLALMLSCQVNAPATTESAVSTDFQVITHGEVVVLKDHMSSQGFTVFDFYADWCPPCKKLDESLVDLKDIYGSRLTVRKLDIVDWKSELVKHHKIADLPYLIIYDESQQLLAQGPSNQVLPKLVAALNK